MWQERVRYAFAVEAAGRDGQHKKCPLAEIQYFTCSLSLFIGRLGSFLQEDGSFIFQAAKIAGCFQKVQPVWPIFKKDLKLPWRGQSPFPPAAR
jgi:hypothetical protein